MPVDVCDWVEKLEIDVYELLGRRVRACRQQYRSIYPLAVLFFLLLSFRHRLLVQAKCRRQLQTKNSDLGLAETLLAKYENRKPCWSAYWRDGCGIQYYWSTKVKEDKRGISGNMRSAFCIFAREGPSAGCDHIHYDVITVAFSLGNVQVVIERGFTASSDDLRTVKAL